MHKGYVFPVEGKITKHDICSGKYRHYCFVWVRCPYCENTSQVSMRKKPWIRTRRDIEKPKGKYLVPPHLNGDKICPGVGKVVF